MNAATPSSIPPEAFDYRLGNRSALEWVIDQYQVTEDKRSGIRFDPNRAAKPVLRRLTQIQAYRYWFDVRRNAE